MTDAATLPRPWSVRQREVLRHFLNEAAVRARKEVEIPRDSAQRDEAIEKEHRETIQRLEDEFRRKHAETEQAFERSRQTALSDCLLKNRQLCEKRDRRKSDARAEYDAAKDALVVKFKEARWSIRTVYESDRKVARDELARARKSYRKTAEQVVAERKKGFTLLKGWRVLERPPQPLEAQDYAGADVVGALDNCAVDAAQSFADLEKMRLPGFVRGIAPHVCLILLWAAASVPALFLEEWHWWILGSALAIVPIGLWACRNLRRWTHGKVLTLFQVQHQAVADARALRGECDRRATKRHRARMQQLNERTLAQLTDLRRATEKRLSSLRRRRAARLQATTEKYEPLLQRLQQGQQAAEQAGQELHRRNMAELQARHNEQMQQAAERHATQRDANLRRRAEDWGNLVASWTHACTWLTCVFEEVDHESRRWFGDWDPAHHPTDRGLPWGLRFGMLTIKQEQIPESVPVNSELVKPDLAGFAVPALLPFPERASLLFEAKNETARRAGLRALEAILLRAWLALPPGKLRCTIIDPVGRGEHFSAFMHLDDHDPALVNSRIWTEAQHIEERLADLTAHMETVLQKYLRNQFQSLAEYNAQAGEVAEPFRFLIAANFPTTFSPEACRRLISLATAGARCGICVFVLGDTRQELPQSISWEDLEKACTVLRWRNDRYAIHDEVYARFPLELEELPSEEQCTSILQEVGARAVRAMKVEVPFTSIAPDIAAWWTEDSRTGLAAPLGRAGANRLQHLTLGQGTSQHVLIAGKTGSGKSTLFHVLIMQLALRYSPDEVELYLIDFKKGVEFKTYASHALPHARVVAVESEREFGLSVLQRLDSELSRRGEIFRRAGVTDLASYRNLHQGNGNPAGTPPMPRIAMIVDEFQEFFVEDDKLAQEAALLLDRLVRQGRAFGMHILLGSQTLGGAYSLARSTIDQMAVRIALQCSEADANLILSRDNTEARLLSRPGEAIYNAANGLLEGNNFFQIVWLDDERRDEMLQGVDSLCRRNAVQRAEPLIVFEGNVLADMRTNPSLVEHAAHVPEFAGTTSWSAWLGDAVAIKEPTRAIFRRQSGCNLLFVGQQEQAALAMFTSTALSIAADAPNVEPMPMVFAQAVEGLGNEVVNVLPEIAPVTLTPQRELPALLSDWTAELDKRTRGESAPTARFLFLYGVHRMRDVRKPDDDFGYSRKGEEQNPYRQLIRMLREGPSLGLFTIVWCDTVGNLQRCFDRSTLREFEMRVVFQMSANDSSALMDTPAASKLGPMRAIFYTEDQGKLEKFRPYALPAVEWLLGKRPGHR